MARSYLVRSGAIALAAGATKTLILLDPGVISELSEMGVSFDGSAAGAGIAWELVRVVTLGTPAGTTGTITKRDPNDNVTPSATALVNLTTEPTTYEILLDGHLPPNGGALIRQTPLGDEELGAETDKRLGLRVITPAGVSPNARAYFKWKE